MSHDERDDREVFYARKAWELVYTLGASTSGDCIAQLKLEDWDHLMEILSSVGPGLPGIITAYEMRYNYNGDEDDFSNDFPIVARVINLYENWYDHNFDETPILGYETSAWQMKTFWDAKDMVYNYLRDPNYEIWMITSY